MSEPKQKISPRREGRQTAAQLLYALDLNPQGRPDYVQFWSLHRASALARKFAEELVNGAWPLIKKIDEKLVPALENWELSRLEVIDRAILRLAVYEMWWCLDTPPLVAINEAITTAKELGTPDSARFVNGVLDRLKGSLERPLRTTTAKTST